MNRVEDTQSIILLGLRYTLNICAVLYTSSLIYESIGDALAEYDSITSYIFIIFIVSQLFNGVLSRFGGRAPYLYEIKRLFVYIIVCQLIFLCALCFVFSLSKNQNLGLVFLIFTQQFVISIYSYLVTLASVEGLYKKIALIGIVDSLLRVSMIFLLDYFEKLDLISFILCGVISAISCIVLLLTTKYNFNSSNSDSYSVFGFFKENFPAVASNYLRQHPLTILINDGLKEGNKADRMIAGQFYNLTLGLLNGSFQQVRTKFINDKSKGNSLTNLGNSFTIILRSYLVLVIAFHFLWLFGVGSLINFWWEPQTEFLGQLIWVYTNLAILEFFQGLIMMFHLGGSRVKFVQTRVLLYEVISVAIVGSLILCGMPVLVAMILKIVFTLLSFVMYVELLDTEESRIFYIGIANNKILCVSALVVGSADLIIFI